MTYWRYWNLSNAPFSGDPRQPLFRGVTVEEALARIDFLVGNQRSLGVLQGPSGIGKSSILRFVGQNPPSTEETPNVRTVRASMLGMRGGELYSNLARFLVGSSSLSSLPQAPIVDWNQLCDFLYASAREQVQILLLLDDVESATREAEVDLARLLSMSFPLTVIMGVEAEGASAVGRSLLDRCELRIDLPPWSVSQTAEFLSWSCQQAGRDEPIFTDRALDRIQAFSNGIPRRIVQLANLALVAGAVAQVPAVDDEHVEQIALEVSSSAEAA